MPTWLLDPRVLTAAGVAVALLLGAWAIKSYGDGRYDAGVQKERAAWTQVINEATEARDQAQADLDALRADRETQRNERVIVRETIVREARQEIADAPDTESRYAAYLAVRSRLRDEATARLAAARADYLSTVPAE